MFPKKKEEKGTKQRMWLGDDDTIICFGRCGVPIGFSFCCYKIFVP